MKKYVSILLLSFSIFYCNTIQKEETANNSSDYGDVIVKDEETGKELVLTKEEFLSIHELAKKYIALQEDISGANIKENVKVEEIDENTYEVQIKLNNELYLNALVEVNNEELFALRKKMNRLTTEEPTVSIEEIKKGKRFKITMKIDDVEWASIVDAEIIEGFQWQSFWVGIGSGIVIGIVIVAGANSGGSSAAPLMLLLAP